jgi:hypothetical protein
MTRECINSFLSQLFCGLSALLIASSPCLAQSPDKIYSKKLNDVILKVQQAAKIHESDILGIMPNTSNEATIFYKQDYDKRTSKAFQTLNKLIAEKASSNGEILSGYLKLSQFVDGYFAEAYFDRIEAIARNANKLFCEEYDKLDPKSVSRIVIVYNKCCEKNMPG